MPGSMNSPVRVSRGVGDDPVCVARAKGVYLCDVDGNEYVGSWGPMIFGHA
jgi:glutamate-1-semialdehyde 2,1-aminomutase